MTVQPTGSTEITEESMQVDTALPGASGGNNAYKCSKGAVDNHLINSLCPNQYTCFACGSFSHKMKLLQSHYIKCKDKLVSLHRVTSLLSL